jgi:hypothetical protein
MALDFPNSPSVGQLYPSPAVAGVPVYKWNGTTWDAQVTTGTDAPSDGNAYGRLNGAWSQVLPIGGGTLTGNLTTTANVIMNSAAPAITMNKASGGGGGNCSIQGNTAGLSRWVVEFGNASAESGSNVGSDFDIIRYNDAGGVLDVPLKIFRSTGAILTTADVNSGGSLISTGGGVVVNAKAGAGNNANMFYNDETSANKVVTYWERASGTYHVSIGSQDWQFQSGGQFRCSLGYVGKQGFSGGFGGNSWNMYYNAGVMQLWVDATNLGNISVTSDYRTKKDVEDLPSMWATVKKLRPISYTNKDFTPPAQIAYNKKAKADGLQVSDAPMFKGDNIERWGFLAHEMQKATIDSAANCAKDAPDAVQSPNPWTIIAALTKTLQEAMERIEVLEGKRKKR